MRRLIAIITISISLIALATFEVVAVKKINTNLLKDVIYLEEITKQNQDNIVNISNEITQIKDNWDNIEPTLCLMFNHKDLSTVTDTLALIQAYVFNNDYDNAVAQVHLLKEYAEKNEHVMGFNLQNLL